MTPYLCMTCGTQYAPSDVPPARCAVCEDDRQYVGWDGQRWTTLDALAREHEIRIEEVAGLVALGASPAFGIDHRSFLLPTDAGNLLWESQSVLTDDAVAQLRSLGGVDRILVSHPHFHGAMAAWSDALGGVPILVHEADRAWVQHPHPALETWSGDVLRLSDDVTLVRAGGHFPGSTVLHWARGPREGGALFSGDALQVSNDRRGVSFMYSYPNLVPMRTSDVVAMRDRLDPYTYRDVFGYTWGRDILGDAPGGGRAAVDRSFTRYLAAVRG